MGNAVVRVNGRAYENEGFLADGGFASVFRVRRGGALYALKWTRGIGDDAQLQRVLLEIQVQRKLLHPNTMRIVEAEVRVSGGKGGAHTTPRKEVLMVFPLYPRGTLQQYLESAFQRQKPAFSESECLRVFTLVVEAVLELQARGFAHRDVKPHNILLSSSDPMEPILTDFGSIAPVKTTVTTAHEALQLFEDAAQFCSAGFRAPELWESHSSTGLRGDVDYGRADVWSLGCLLYAMAYGPFSPFENAVEGVMQLAIFSGNVRFPPGNKRFDQTFSAPFIALINSMLTVAPHERPTIYQLLDKVDEVRSERRAPSRRSLSLRRSISGKQGSLRPSTHDDWADFSVFNDDSDHSISPQSDLTVASAVSSTVSQSSWKVVARKASMTDTIASPRSTTRVASLKDREQEQRQKLSARGRQLLALALTS